MKLSESLCRFTFKNLLPNTQPQTRSEMYGRVELLAKQAEQMEAQLENIAKLLEVTDQAKTVIMQLKTENTLLKEKLAIVEAKSE